MGLAKSDSWVECDAHRVNAAAYRPRDRLSKKIPHFRDNIPVVRRGLHGHRGPLHVHDHDARAAARDDGRHFRVAAEAGDVVDNVRPLRQRGLRHGCFRGVDGNQKIPGGGPQAFDDRDHACQFLLGGDRAGSRPCGFTANV